MLNTAVAKSKDMRPDVVPGSNRIEHHGTGKAWEKQQIFLLPISYLISRVFVGAGQKAYFFVRSGLHVLMNEHNNR